MSKEDKRESQGKSLADKSRLVKLLRSIGVLPDPNKKEKKEEPVSEEPRVIPAAALQQVPRKVIIPKVPSSPAVPVRIRGEDRIVEVPVAVPVPIPVEAGVNPLSKLSSMLPQFFLEKRANPQVGYNPDGTSRDGGVNGVAASNVDQMPSPITGTLDTAGMGMDIQSPGKVSPLTSPIDQAPSNTLADTQQPLPGVNQNGDISMDMTQTRTASDNPFNRMLMSKFAQDYYAGGLAPGASMLIAGLGGYGGAQVGDALAGLGTERAAARQLANVEGQIMQLATNPHLSSREKKRMLQELNREAQMFGVRQRAVMPNTAGQAEAIAKRMSQDLAGQAKARRLPGARGLGMVAGAAAPFIIPDFLRRMGVV